MFFPHGSVELSDTSVAPLKEESRLLLETPPNYNIISAYYVHCNDRGSGGAVGYGPCTQEKQSYTPKYTYYLYYINAEYDSGKEKASTKVRSVHPLVFEIAINNMNIYVALCGVKHIRRAMNASELL